MKKYVFAALAIVIIVCSVLLYNHSIEHIGVDFEYLGQRGRFSPSHFLTHAKHYC